MHCSVGFNSATKAKRNLLQTKRLKRYVSNVCAAEKKLGLPPDLASAAAAETLFAFAQLDPRTIVVVELANCEWKGTSLGEQHSKCLNIIAI